MYGSRGRRQDLGGPVVSLPVLAGNWQNWQIGRTPTRFVSTPPRPIHQWKAPDETVTTVILHGGVLYYNLSYGRNTPKSQLAAKKPLFLSETMIYTYLCAPRLRLAHARCRPKRTMPTSIGASIVRHNQVVFIRIQNKTEIRLPCRQSMHIMKYSAHRLCQATRYLIVGIALVVQL